MEYLGHIIDGEGLHPTQEKVQAIQEAPRPRNITELRSFLGLTNYYAKFLPNLSARLSPLYRLLQKQQKWTWQDEQEYAFIAAKNALQEDSVLVHYDESKPLILTCDASPYGIGAVLSHTMVDGSDRPVAYASRSLSKPEKGYAQMEREALAIVFGVQKFHYYLYGRPFTIQSDHKPLSFLFNQKKGIPVLSSARVQRWALTLSAYRYNIRYRPGKEISNADGLSRLPLPTEENIDNPIPCELVNLLHVLSDSQVDATQIKSSTDKDTVLSVVRQMVISGSSLPEAEEFKPYRNRRGELSVAFGCLLLGSRVIIPQPCRKAVIKELHVGHQGICKMKSLARSYVWWPGVDSDIELCVKDCVVCQESRLAPTPAPLHPWEYPEQPWLRLHLDFEGPFMGHMFLVIIDSFSKWIDVHMMDTITSTATIQKLHNTFATHGLGRDRQWPIIR